MVNAHEGNAVSDPGRDIALLIDFENISAQAGFDPCALVEYLETRGRVLIRRAYADWHQFAHFKVRLLQAAIQLVECPAYHQRKRNSTDIRVSVDAIELAITRPELGVFVIVSGDSDFIPLIERLRELGRYVIVVTAEAVASHLLERFCDELLVLPDRQDFEDDPLGVSSQLLPISRRSEPLLDFGLLSEALDRLGKDRPPPHRSSELKDMMLQLDPDFDQRLFGFRKFQDYLQQARHQGEVEIAGRRFGNVLIQRPGVQEDAPTPLGLGERLDQALAASQVRFLGSDLQPRVLGAIHKRLLNEVWRQGDALFEAMLADELGLEAQTGALSAASLQRVMRLLVQAGCVRWSTDEQRQVRLSLGVGVDRLEDFINAHDRTLIALAGAEGLSFDEEQWALLLYGDGALGSRVRALRGVVAS